MPSPRYEAALQRLRERTQKSQGFRPRAERVLALEAVPTFAMPVPLYVESGNGAYMRDIDGNTYLDLAMGFGSLILGHRPPGVLAAMRGQLELGWHLILPSEAQCELAELLVEASPCAESVVFQNSGTEATMCAMRVARAFTGKTRIGVFGGGYHGTHDYALVQEDPKSALASAHAKTVGGGIPDIVRDGTMLALPYRHPMAFDLIRKHKDELAAIIIQPVQNTTPHLDNEAYLKELRALCNECEVLLIFDEVVTGFRLAYGGGQEFYGVTPDLAAYGKIIGGGTAVGALCGRQDIMDMFARPGGRGVFAGGTFNGNPLTMAAGVATLKALRQRKEELYPALRRRGERIAAAVSDHAETREMAVTLMHAASIQCFHFKAGPIESYRDIYPANRAAEEAFYAFVLDRGILLPSFHVYFLSATHNDVMIDNIAAAFIEALDDCRADGLL